MFIIDKSKRVLFGDFPIGEPFVFEYENGWVEWFDKNKINPDKNTGNFPFFMAFMKVDDLSYINLPNLTINDFRKNKDKKFPKITGYSYSEAVCFPITHENQNFR